MGLTWQWAAAPTVSAESSWNLRSIIIFYQEKKLNSMFRAATLKDEKKPIK